VSQPKSHLIQLFSWILDDGRAPATGIRRVNLEPTDGNTSPVSVRSALFKVAGYPGNFSRRAGVTAAADRAGRHAARRTRRCTDRRAVARPWLGRWCGVEWDVRPGGRSPVTERTHLCGGGSRRPARRTPPAQATVAVRLGGEGVLMSLAGGGGPGELSERVFFLCLLSFRGFLYEGPGGQMICPRLLGWHAPRLFVALCARFNLE